MSHPICEDVYGIYSPTTGLLDSGRAWADAVARYASPRARRRCPYRRMGDGKSTAQIEFIPGTRVCATFGTIAKSPVLRLR